MVDKLEAGKTYVFVDEQAKEDWINRGIVNEQLYAKLYNNGFTLDEIYCDEGWIEEDNCVISSAEFEFFKLKEDSTIQQESQTPVFNSAEGMIGWYVDLSDEISTKAFCEYCDKFDLTSYLGHAAKEYYEFCKDYGYSSMGVDVDKDLTEFDSDMDTLKQFKVTSQDTTETSPDAPEQVKQSCQGDCSCQCKSGSEVDTDVVVNVPFGETTMQVKVPSDMMSLALEEAADIQAAFNQPQSMSLADVQGLLEGNDLIVEISNGKIYISSPYEDEPYQVSSEEELTGLIAAYKLLQGKLV